MKNKKSVVIIGSGLGGLICGTILATEGYDITVLEMNKQIGGNLQTYSRDKHLFDSGVHYIGGMDKGQNLYKIFKYLGIFEKLQMQKMNVNAFDKVYFYSDNKTYSYAQGYDLFRKTLIDDFPDESKAINDYCDYMIKVCSRFPLYNLRMGDYMEKSEFTEIDTKAFIDSLTTNERLRNVLAGNNLLYSGVANKTPVFVHALVVNSYIESSYRMINGGSQIAKYLHRIILNHGGRVLNRQKVVKLESKDNKIIAAETDTENIYHGDLFISNIHPANTLKLINKEEIRLSYRNRISKLENSISMFIVNITLKSGMFLHEDTNYYCHTKDDVWSAMDYTTETWPHSFAFFYSSKKQNTAFADGVTIMTNMKFDDVKQWLNTYNTVGTPGDRGKEYDDFKKQKAEHLINLAEHRFPGLKEAIKNYYVSTPLTFRDYMGTEDGSVYGVEKDYNHPFKTIISPQTKISNLYLTGQNLNLHGVLGVAISAIVTCSSLLGLEYLIERIEEAQHE